MTKEATAVVEKPRARVPAPMIHKPENPENLLSVIRAAASDPRCDVAKMQALLDMMRTEEDREAKKAFDRAFIALQDELPSIRRDGKIEIKAKDSRGERTGPVQQSTPYATFNNIMKVLKPLLTKHGFGLSFATEPTANFERLLVKGRLVGHGHEWQTSFPLPAETSGSKNNVQGWGSSMSYGKRYCTIALLNLVSEAPEDADADGHQGDFKRGKEGLVEASEPAPAVSKAQVAELEVTMAKCGISAINFCSHYGLKAVAELPSDLFEAAKKAMLDHAAARAQERR